MARASDTNCTILNLRMVQAIDPAATSLLAGTRRELLGLGKVLIFSESSTWWQLLIDAGRMLIA